MAIDHGFAGIPVAHLDSALAWYERLFGRPPDMIPNEHEAVWRLTDTGSIYVVADTKRAGNALLTLAVENLERHVAELRERGLDVGAIDATPGSPRKVAIADPEGNVISFFQTPERHNEPSGDSGPRAPQP